MRPVELAVGGRRLRLSELALPLAPDQLLAGDGPLELEIGFGKGRFLLARAAEQPSVRLLGIEMASKYFRLVERRAERRGLDNVALLCGEAAYLMSAVLPGRTFRAVHVYFPDPWPKDRHHKRRLFDRETVDLLLALLAPGGQLFFATDHLDYGAVVAELLESHPALSVERVAGWPEGPRTNYEIKYEREGRPILRLVVTLRPDVSLIHPEGLEGLVVGASPAGGVGSAAAEIR